MKVWMVEQHRDVDDYDEPEEIAITGIYSTLEKAKKAAETKAKERKIFDNCEWDHYERSGMWELTNFDDISWYVTEMEVE